MTMTAEDGGFRQDNVQWIASLRPLLPMQPSQAKRSTESSNERANQTGNSTAKASLGRKRNDAKPFGGRTDDLDDDEEAAAQD